MNHRNWWCFTIQRWTSTRNLWVNGLVDSLILWLVIFAVNGTSPANFFLWMVDMLLASDEYIYIYTHDLFVGMGQNWSPRRDHRWLSACIDHRMKWGYPIWHITQNHTYWIYTIHIICLNENDIFIFTYTFIYIFIHRIIHDYRNICIENLGFLKQQFEVS